MDVSEIVVVAEMELAPGREDEALGVLSELCEQTHARDDGCLIYAVHRVVDDEQRVFLIEKWRSREDLDRHLGTVHVQAKREREKELFVGKAKASFLESTGFGLPGMAAI
ncbi:MAG: antibiotic biosynthesis monooxygenase [Actinobacteria bacterium]|nr:antibiotic biosynthesis monooxygenase [Actinomycetota bacterium]